MSQHRVLQGRLKRLSKNNNYYNSLLVTTSLLSFYPFYPSFIPFIQKQWITARRNGTKLYRSKVEIKIILRKYDGKLYTFLTPDDKDNNSIRDIISIALVRIAQKGNVTAKQEIIKLVRLTIDEWIENCPKISRWKGYEYLIQKRIEGCVRCYRYSGSFMGYLFKTLEYAGRGLRPITEYSLDEPLYSWQKKRIDTIAQNPEPDGILI